MSTQQPSSPADRLASRRRRGPSAVKQVLVLLMGVAASAAIAWSLTAGSLETNPWWVLVVIPCGFLAFLGFLATTAWSMRAATGQTGRTAVGAGAYLVTVLLVGGLMTFARSRSSVEVPDAAWIAPLAAAGVVAALWLVSAARRGAVARAETRSRQGRHVEGVVTDSGLAAFADTPNPKITTLTISFRDLSGAERWIVVGAMQSPERPIEVGDRVDVWFDAAAPGDIDRISVELDNGASRTVGRPKLPRND